MVPRVIRHEDERGKGKPAAAQLSPASAAPPSPSPRIFRSSGGEGWVRKGQVVNAAQAAPQRAPMAREQRIGWDRCVCGEVRGPVYLYQKAGGRRPRGMRGRRGRISACPTPLPRRHRRATPPPRPAFSSPLQPQTRASETQRRSRRRPHLPDKTKPGRRSPWCGPRGVHMRGPEKQMWARSHCSSLPTHTSPAGHSPGVRWVERGHFSGDAAKEIRPTAR